MAYATDQDLAGIVKARLAKKGMTLRALAREMGISETYLSDFVHGRRNAGPTIIDKLGYQAIPHYPPKPKASSGNATDENDLFLRERK